MYPQPCLLPPRDPSHAFIALSAKMRWKAIAYLYRALMTYLPLVDCLMMKGFTTYYIWLLAHIKISTAFNLFPKKIITYLKWMHTLLDLARTNLCVKYIDVLNHWLHILAIFIAAHIIKHSSNMEFHIYPACLHHSGCNPLPCIYKYINI